MSDKWDRRFLELARHISSWSKDPSSRVGAVIVRPDKTIASIGYNGFPRGVEDSKDRLEKREVKYTLVVHAEMNAILNASENLGDYTLYTWPFPTCHECAKSVIQSGIGRVVSYAPDEGFKERWGQSNAIALLMYGEADVEYHIIPQTEIIEWPKVENTTEENSALT